MARKRELMKENAALLEVVEFLATKAKVRGNYEEVFRSDGHADWYIPWWHGLADDIKVLKERRADTERNDLAKKRTGLNPTGGQR